MTEKMTASDLGQALWNCADEMRSIMDANEYKDYLLGLVFYKTLSDNQLRTVMNLLEEREPTSLNEAQTVYESAQKDPDIWPNLIKELEMRFNVAIEPNRTFNAFCKAINEKTFLLTNLKDAFTAIEQAKNGFYAGLFEGFNIYSEKLGNTNRKKNAIVSKCMMTMATQNFSLYNKDILGDAYEYLIAKFAENSGKKAGEFYTPKQVSIILSQIVTHGQEHVDGFSIYDACCGSASLLLHAKDYIDANKRKHIYYFGQEKNTNTYRLARMNCMLHQIPYQYQHFRNGDTLDEDWPTNEPTVFHAVVMNPPYSATWSKSKKMLTDPRFSPYEELAPPKKADYAFLLHGFYHLREDGMMGIVLPLGVLFRGGAEGTIRKHLIENGSICAVVGLASGLFYSTGIPVCLVFLKKNNVKRDVLFVDASKEFKREKIQNYLTDENVKKIVDTVIARKDVEKFAHLATYAEIVKNDYNLNIPRYVDTYEEEAPVNIDVETEKLIKLDQKAKEAEEKVKAYFCELGLKVGNRMAAPKLRFHDEQGQEYPKWLRATFKNLFLALRKNALARDTLNYEHGNIKNIHYGDILVKLGATVQSTSPLVPYINTDKIPKSYDVLQCGDIIIADTAEDETAGKGIEIINDSIPTISGLHTLPYRPQTKFAPGYLGYFLNSPYYHKQLIPLLHGIKVLSVTKAELEKTIISYPTLPEQQKIADFLTTIDHQIEVEEKRLETMKIIKKGLLQQMFI